MSSGAWGYRGGTLVWLYSLSTFPDLLSALGKSQHPSFPAWKQPPVKLVPALPCFWPPIWHREASWQWWIWLVWLTGKELLTLLKLTFCLFLVKRESYLCFFTFFCPAFLCTCLTFESGIWKWMSYFQLLFLVFMKLGWGRAEPKCVSCC